MRKNIKYKIYFIALCSSWSQYTSEPTPLDELVVNLNFKNNQGASRDRRPSNKYIKDTIVQLRKKVSQDPLEHSDMDQEDGDVQGPPGGGGQEGSRMRSKYSDYMDKFENEALIAENPKDDFHEFAKFKETNGKNYTSRQEEKNRFRIFSQNLRMIEKHNQEGHSWKMRVTKFADLTKDEFVTTYASGRLPLRNTANFAARSTGPSNSAFVGETGKKTKQPMRDLSDNVDWKNEGVITRVRDLPENVDWRNEGVITRDLPENVDWRKEGVITSVRDQGHCGSCWAFAAADNIAAYAKINDMEHDLVQLSTQHLTSCAKNPYQCGVVGSDGGGGCQGSIEAMAFIYTSLFGVVAEENYPYTSQDGDDRKCEFDATTMEVTASIRGYETLLNNDMEAVMNHLAYKGPLSAAVDVSNWRLYDGATIFDGCPYAENIDVNHIVQLVGYGIDPDHGGYWLIKNSFGEDWGDEGYMKLKREAHIKCGKDSTPLHGTACQGDGVEEQEVCGTCAIIFHNSYPIGAKYVK